MSRHYFFYFWIMPIGMILVIELFYYLVLGAMAPVQVILAVWSTSLIKAVVITQQLSQRFKHLQSILIFVYLILFMGIARLQIH